MNSKESSSETRSDWTNRPSAEAKRHQSTRLSLWFCLFVISWLCYFLSVETLRTSQELHAKKDLFGQARLAFQTMRSIPRLEQRLRFEEHRQVDVFLPQWRTSRYIEGMDSLLALGRLKKDWVTLFWMEEEQYQSYPYLNSDLAPDTGSWKTYLGRVFRLDSDPELNDPNQQIGIGVNALKALNDMSVTENSLQMPPWVIGVGFPQAEGRDKSEQIASILDSIRKALESAPSEWLVEPLLEGDLRQVDLQGLPPEGWTQHAFRLRVESGMEPEKLFPAVHNAE